MTARLRFGAALVIVGLLYGCATNAPSTTHEPHRDSYKAAIADAAVIESAEIVSLPSIVAAEAEVVTWTAYPQSFSPGKAVTLDWGDVWVTLSGDVKKHCERFAKISLVGDLQKLLGLPAKDEKRRFVTMVASTSTMFRPCADPSLTANRCSAEIPAAVSSEHLAWYARQVADSYRNPKGFPWTRLGYTYNWTSGASKVGPAEFVIRRHSTVRVVSVIETEKYCSR